MIRDQLHSLTHRMPGVPPHIAEKAPRDVRPTPRINKRHVHTHRAQQKNREPRVFVRWQHWIASRVS